MKPCRSKRRQIAWLAAGVLESQSQQELQAHLGKCAGCRDYLAALSDMTAELKRPEPLTDIEASPAFHSRVLKSLNRAAGRPRGYLIPGGFQFFSPRARLAGAAALAAAAVLILLLRPSEPTRPEVADTAPRTAAAVRSERELSPTFSTYHVAANQSLETLDEVLTAQARHHLPRTATYRVSGSVEGSVSD